jgi:hypothetical protein
MVARNIKHGFTKKCLKIAQLLNIWTKIAGVHELEETRTGGGGGQHDSSG